MLLRFHCLNEMSALVHILQFMVKANAMGHMVCKMITVRKSHSTFTAIALHSQHFISMLTEADYKHKLNRVKQITKILGLICSLMKDLSAGA